MNTQRDLRIDPAGPDGPIAWFSRWRLLIYLALFLVAASLILVSRQTKPEPPLPNTTTVPSD